MFLNEIKQNIRNKLKLGECILVRTWCKTNSLNNSIIII